MTFFQVLKNILIPRQEAEILMAFLLKKPIEFLMAHPETEVRPVILNKFKNLEKKRLHGWSIAVLIGHKEFYGLDFKVDKNVLIPRPETELMVEEVLSLINATPDKKLLVDLGTGSGAIIIACANEIKKTLPIIYKKTEFRAIDISVSALKIAKENAKYNQQTKIKFRQGNLLEPLINQKDIKKLTSLNLIMAANLPYLTPSQIKVSPSIKKEPSLALVAGKDGLKYYRELFGQIKSINNNFKPLRANILCEIDSGQAKPIKTLVKKHFPRAKIEIKKDLADKKRLAIISI